MVRLTTVSVYYDATDGKEIRLVEGSCNSDDIKPDNAIAGGSLITEVDTGDVYLFNENTRLWVKQFSLQS